MRGGGSLSFAATMFTALLAGCTDTPAESSPGNAARGSGGLPGSEPLPQTIVGSGLLTSNRCPGMNMGGAITLSHIPNVEMFGKTWAGAFVLNPDVEDEAQFVESSDFFPLINMNNNQVSVSVPAMAKTVDEVNHLLAQEFCGVKSSNADFFNWDPDVGGCFGDLYYDRVCVGPVPATMGRTRVDVCRGDEDPLTPLGLSCVTGEFEFVRSS